MEDLTFFRLITGEDIVAEIIEVTDSAITIKKPMKIIYTTSKQSGKNVVAIMLARWVYTEISEDEFFYIQSRDILLQSSPSKHLKMYYQESMDYFDEEESEEDDFEETEDVMEMIKEYLEGMAPSDKKKLH